MCRANSSSIFSFDMIKPFIIRCSVFIAVAFAALAVVSGLHLLVLKNIVRPAHLKIDAEVIIIGDSHTQTAVDPDLLKSSVNISSNSMHYAYAYAILNNVLPANPQVKAVVLGFSYHNLNEYYDALLRDARKYRVRLGEYYNLFGGEERELVRAGTGIYYATVAKYHYGVPIQLYGSMYWKAVLGGLNARDFSFWGNPHVSQVSNINRRSLTGTLERHFYLEDRTTPQKHSDMQKHYLRKIIELCQARGVHLYLLMTPVHPAYKVNVPPEFARSFDDFSKELKNNPGVDVWDYSTGPYADFMFGDADHLNIYGARMFSRILEKRLEELR